MKKLLIFHPTIAPYRIDFFNSLFEAFDTVVCLTNTNDQTFNYNEIYSKLQFKPILLKCTHSLFGKCFFDEYRKWLDKFQPDIVVVGEFGIGTLLVLLYRLWKHKKYKILSICDDSYDMLAENNDFSKIHRVARRILSPYLDEIIVVEPQTRDWYQEKYGKGICFPIIRREDLQRKMYEKVLNKSIGLQKKYALENRNVFLFVGRLIALKNVKTLINSFSQLDRNENFLIIVGSGEEENRLRQLTVDLELDNILFTGRLEGEELYSWYNVADYFVLASYLEPFGAVTNEALLAGCYSLISNKAGSRCLIEDGVNGFTFESMDVNELNEKMRLAIKKFPKIRPLNSVKPNLMSEIYAYDHSIRHIIRHMFEI